MSTMTETVHNHQEAFPESPVSPIHVAEEDQQDGHEELDRLTGLQALMERVRIFFTGSQPRTREEFSASLSANVEEMERGSHIGRSKGFGHYGPIN